MSIPDPASGFSFSELVFSDLDRYRPGERGWLRVLARCLVLPGLIASVILRAQQCLARSGHKRAANLLRSVGNVVIGADFGPGMRVGRGLMLAHPVGVTMGSSLVIGDNVTMAGGVTCAAKFYDGHQDEQEFPTICDNAIIGAHAVIVGGVRIGRNAVVGANSTVIKDVPDDAVVHGNPARRIGTRESAA
jgi:serine O-acetyltransferase